MKARQTSRHRRGGEATRSAGAPSTRRRPQRPPPSTASAAPARRRSQRPRNPPAQAQSPAASRSVRTDFCRVTPGVCLVSFIGVCPPPAAPRSDRQAGSARRKGRRGARLGGEGLFRRDVLLREDPARKPAARRLLSLLSRACEVVPRGGGWAGMGQLA